MQMAVLDDLAEESAALDALVAGLDPAGWGRATPAEGWTIAHQIAHLAWTDTRALLAVQDPDAFAREFEAAAAHFDTYVDDAAAQGAELPPDELLAQWRASRTRLQEVLAAQPHGIRFRWFGPPMSTASMATGRLMETWAHGEDVADTLGVRREPTARLRHVARIGVRARDFAFAVHGRPAPAGEFRVELTAPDGSLWTFGPADAAQRVTGTALGFCLLAVRRRHRDDVDLRAQGPDADAWLSVVQAFAGPPGRTRPPSTAAEAEAAAEETAG